MTARFLLQPTFYSDSQAKKNCRYFVLYFGFRVKSRERFRSEEFKFQIHLYIQYKVPKMKILSIISSQLKSCDFVYIICMYMKHFLKLRIRKVALINFSSNLVTYPSIGNFFIGGIQQLRSYCPKQRREGKQDKRKPDFRGTN